MSDPLTMFVFQGFDAPFTDLGQRVVPVRCKSGLAVARTGSIAHQVTAVAAVFHHGKAQYGARWRCLFGSADVILLADADSHGGVCKRCLAAAAGPTVYRCYGADGGLLYIGSTVNRGWRMTHHASTTPWWPEVADVRYEDYPTIAMARAAERMAIITEHPSRNRRWATVPA